MSGSWITVLPGSVLTGLDQTNKNKQLKISKPSRMFMEKDYDGNNIVYFLKNGWSTNVWAIGENTKYEKFNIPPMKREFISLAVKNSVWEFERDWTFQCYDASPNIYTIKAGTRFTIVNSIMPKRGSHNYQEKHLEIDSNPAFHMFGSQHIPAKEVSHYIKLIKPGQVKIYWRLEKTDGTQWVTKNFASIGNIKSSIRVRFNFLTPSNKDGNVPDWLDNSDNYMKKPNPAEGVFAVQYDHATKKEIHRVDLLTYVMLAHLSQ
jgi:hypothetical protein